MVLKEQVIGALGMAFVCLSDLQRLLAGCLLRLFAEDLAATDWLGAVAGGGQLLVGGLGRNDGVVKFLVQDFDCLFSELGFELGELLGCFGLHDLRVEQRALARHVGGCDAAPGLWEEWVGAVLELGNAAAACRVELLLLVQLDQLAVGTGVARPQGRVERVLRVAQILDGF